jgi:hypothetical protein
MSDLTNGRTEVLLEFQHAHYRLNHTVKVTSAGLKLLEESVGEEEDASMKLAAAVDSVGEPWRKGAVYPDPAGLVQWARHDFAEMALIKAYSGFDSFLTAIEAEVARAIGSGRVTLPPAPPPPPSDSTEQKEEQELNRLTRMCERYNWNGGMLTPYLPLWKFFLLARNCNAHRNGRASEALAALVNQDLKDSLQNLKSRSDAVLPTLPQIVVGARIALAPRHCILASDCLFRIAMVLDAFLLQLIGFDGLVLMALDNALLKESHPARIPQASAEGAMANFLTNRYRVPTNEADSIQALKSLDLWKKALTAFERMPRGN